MCFFFWPYLSSFFLSHLPPRNLIYVEYKRLQTLIYKQDVISRLSPKNQENARRTFVLWTETFVSRWAIFICLCVCQHVVAYLAYLPATGIFPNNSDILFLICSQYALCLCWYKTISSYTSMYLYVNRYQSMCISNSKD